MHKGTDSSDGLTIEESWVLESEEMKRRMGQWHDERGTRQRSSSRNKSLHGARPAWAPWFSTFNGGETRETETERPIPILTTHPPATNSDEQPRPPYAMPSVPSSDAD